MINNLLIFVGKIKGFIVMLIFVFYNSESSSSLNISINPFLHESKKLFKVFLGFTTWFLSSTKLKSAG